MSHSGGGTSQGAHPMPAENEPADPSRKRAAQYLRMSTDQQRYSLESQAALIAGYCQREGYEVVATYEDAACTGVTAAKRIGLQSLLRDVLAGASFTTVLVLDVSRWGRFQNPDEAAHYEFLCREAGVRVRYCAESFEDDDSPTAALMKGVKRVMAAEYSRQLSDRCRAGIRRHMLAGGKGGGHPPYGFARQAFNPDGSPGPVLSPGERRPRVEQTVRLVQGPELERQTLKRIFQLFVRDMRGVTEIAHVLNAEGVPYRRAGPWDEIRVKAILKNEIAIGMYAFNRGSWYFGKPGPRTAPADWLRIRVTPPIVSPSLFAAAQSKFKILKGNIWTDDEMIGKLRRLLRKHGHLSRRLIDGSPHVQGAPAYIRRFGSMSAAYRLAGYEPAARFREHVDKAGLEPEEIVVRLRTLLAEKGYLNSFLIEQCPHLPSVASIKKRLGGLTEAYQLAGFNLTRKEMLVAAHERRRRAPARLSAS